MNKKNKINIPRSARLSFPHDEERVLWLSMLLDAYYIADKGIHEGIKKRLARGETLACAKGCSGCCKIHFTIPVYPLEIVGLYWYVIEKITGDERGVLQKQLMNFRTGKPCPFLLGGICGVHSMRPLACRHFNVFNRSCSPGEDPYYTRRKDVLTPIERYKHKAINAMLPFHGIKDRAKRKQAVKMGYLNGLVQNLHEIDWLNLAHRMDGKQPVLRVG